MRDVYDVTIIGGGVSGAALAYTLSQYEVKVLWLEKENDLAMGASRANTAIVHGGYDPEPDTLMGKFNTQGAYMCMDLCDDLDVEFRKTGSFIIAFNDAEVEHLKLLYERGLANKVKDMEIMDGDQVRTREPHLSKEVVAGLWIPHSGVINPWEFTIAMGEVGVRNGVELKLKKEVTGLTREGDLWVIDVNDGKETYYANYVVNAAGVHSDEIHNWVAEPAFKITPTRGEYYLLDRAIGPSVNAVIFQCPSARGKGVLVSPTVHWNILVGPNSEVIDEKEDTSVTREALDNVGEQAKRSVPDLNLRASIRNYAGIRSNSDYGDFFIQISAPHFVDIAAIKSPGLTCAPPIALYAKGLLEQEGLALKKKTDWKGGRKVVRFKEIPEEKRADFIRENPLYGRVICRCETITEGEIVAAIHREITPVSLDAVKRRAGTGMGRCQGGFCSPRVLEIIARETGLEPTEVMDDAAGSYILTGMTKGEEA